MQISCSDKFPTPTHYLHVQKAEAKIKAGRKDEKELIHKHDFQLD